MGKKIVSGYMKLGLSNDKTVENPSSSSTALLSNTAVPPTTTNSVASQPPHMSTVPQKVSKPSNMKKLYAQASKSNCLLKVEDIL